MTKHIGILTAGGDTPGLNAAIRGVGKAAIRKYGMQITGFKDGFRGLVENRKMRLDKENLSGILTQGGTMLGTSRDKPHKMLIGGKVMNMTDVIVENYEKNHLDCLVCLGGGGTMKNALQLVNKGLNVITLPKTIDNDIAMTDTSFGFDTALGIAVDAIDRLHSTAHSHHRIIVVEIMGHKAGWLALGAGVAGGADVILIPEIPYDINKVAESILRRSKNGSSFSIVAVAEGAISKEVHQQLHTQIELLGKTEGKAERQKIKAEIKRLKAETKATTMEVAKNLEKMTGLESRVTILGHLQRGGTPSAADRILATKLGTTCADYINKEQFGVMVAAKGNNTEIVNLTDVAGKTKLVPTDHIWIDTAQSVGTCFGI